MKVAIMQPTYLPWLGYFALIDYVDLFVFLDSVQFARRSWQQRNRIKGPNGPQLLTVPVLSKGEREQKIEEVQIDMSARHWEKHAKAIQHNYAKSPYYKDYYPEILSLICSERSKLVDLNTNVITGLAKVIGIECRFLRSSGLSADGKKADLIANICSELGASVYVSPVGSMNYLEESNALQALGIQIKYHEYSHPVYQQLFGPFVPFMSVIDLLFNVGPGSLEVLRGSFEKG